DYRVFRGGSWIYPPLYCRSALRTWDSPDYRDLNLTLTRDPADWQPYNPNAERDARIEAEGLYTDPIHQFTTFDEDEDDPKVEPAAPDFDL
ncbi:MAG: hypothetical protein AAFV33_08125, partial [Chloroflexota bacterium]